MLGVKDFSGITSDSRKVKPGYLFAALAGANTDGARFVKDAVARGAVAVLRERGVSQTDIYIEHLDLGRFSTPDQSPAVAALLQQKYAGKHIGLIVAQNQAALDFLADAGYGLLPPGLPVLVTFVGAPGRVTGTTVGPPTADDDPAEFVAVTEKV